MKAPKKKASEDEGLADWQALMSDEEAAMRAWDVEELATVPIQQAPEEMLHQFQRVIIYT